MAPKSKRGKGRPKKAPGTRAQDQLHLGLRFDARTAAKLRAILDEKNRELRASGLPPVTAYALVRHWITERIDAETESLSERG